MTEATGLTRSVDGAHVLTHSAALFGPSLQPRTLVASVARVQQILAEVINQLQCLQFKFGADFNLSHAVTAFRLYCCLIQSQHKPNAYEKNEDRSNWWERANRIKTGEQPSPEGK